MNRYLSFTLFFCFLLAVLPFLCILFLSHGSYPHLPVEIMDDSLYYYTRAVEVSQGHFTVANPYSLEHRNGLTVAFFVADWIWALPLLLGVSLASTIVFNQILYFLLSGYLLHMILSRFDMKEKYIPYAGGICILFVYWYLARPVAMQVVFPVFLLWILSLYVFFENQSRRNTFFLGCTVALSLYVYTYMTQVVLIAMGSGVIVACHPRFKHYRSLWMSAGISFIFSIPFFLYTWKQITAPFYFDTLTRIGLVHTHLFGFSAVFYGTLCLVMLLLVYLFRDRMKTEMYYTVLLVTVGLMIATVSNVISGKDLELAVHIGRFVELWAIILFCCSTGMVWSQKGRSVHVYTLYTVAAIFLVYISVFQIRVWRNINHSLLGHERYASVLEWLDTNTPKDSVIYADASLASYIPIMTHGYVLFHPNTVLYLASNTEIENRYVLSRAFEPLSVEQIKKDMRLYAGAGPTAHQWKVDNRARTVCTFFHLQLFTIECGKVTDQYSLKGESYFTDLKARHDLMQQDVFESLAQFHVGYIVFDRLKDAWALPPRLNVVWRDGDIEVIKL